jgi:tetratricopeptide (TPR) repeat protein
MLAKFHLLWLLPLSWLLFSCVATHKPLNIVPIKPASPAVASSVQLDSLMRSAEAAYEEKNYSDAESFIVKALPLASQAQDGDVKFRQSLTILAMLYEAQGQYDQAIDVYQKLLFVMRVYQDPKIVDVGRHCARLLRNSNRSTEALYLEAFIRKLDPDDFVSEAVRQDDSVWRSTFIRGRNLVKVRRYSDAARVFRLAVRQALPFGMQDARVAVSLKNLAFVYRKQGNEFRAENLEGKVDDVYRLAEFVCGLEANEQDKQFSSCIICHGDRILSLKKTGKILSYIRGPYLGGETWYCQQCQQSW